MPRISQLTALTTPDSSDELAIVDTSAATTKKITRNDLLKGSPLPADTVDTQSIADGAVTADKLGDSGWLSLTAASGFTSTGAQYRKIGNIVYLKGQIDKNSGNIATAETLTTLPAGYRPVSTHAFAGIGAGPAFTKMLVTTNGNVASASTPTTTTAYMRLDNVIFAVD